MTGLEAYQSMRLPSGRWRQRARATMLEVLHSVKPGSPALGVLALVDASYPFGERKHHPYKAWLVERKILIDALGLAPGLEPPDSEDIQVCEVAHDLVEESRVDEARKLMDEQAPRRLNRACPACGAKVGAECREIGDVIVTREVKDADGEALVRGEALTKIVPHDARLRVDSGPLFGAAR